MMNMVRYHINLFRNYTDRKVLGNKAPESIPEFIGTMCTIAVMPDGTVRAHDDHAVQECRKQHPQAKILEQEQQKERQQA
jgi:hypothetical protein